MFKEIENELMSIMSNDAIEKITHQPSLEIAKTMELLYDIRFESIQRVYLENMGRLMRMVVVYNSEDNKIKQPDLCPINGKLYHITFFPSGILDKSENNIINLTKAIIIYSSLRVSLLIDIYGDITEKTSNNILSKVYFQAVPVITCAVIRQLYAGENVPKIIYMTLCDTFPLYKDTYSEEGINSLFTLFDEGLTVNELLDNAFICAVKPNDKNYPGIWTSAKESKQCNQE